MVKRFLAFCLLFPALQAVTDRRVFAEIQGSQVYFFAYQQDRLDKNSPEKRVTIKTHISLNELTTAEARGCYRRAIEDGQTNISNCIAVHYYDPIIKRSNRALHYIYNYPCDYTKYLKKNVFPVVKQYIVRRLAALPAFSLEFKKYCLYHRKSSIFTKEFKEELLRILSTNNHPDNRRTWFITNFCWDTPEMKIKLQRLRNIR